MAFKPVADLDCDNTTAIGGVNKKTGKKNPTSAEGYFIGTREVDSPKSKTGKANLHVLQTQNGNLGVWGKTNLDQKLKAVMPGQMIRVTFTGMQQTKNNPMYKYSVEVDAENTIEVSASDSTPQNGDEDTGVEQGSDSYADDDQDDSDPGADGQPADEQPPQQQARPPRQAAQAPSAARQAQVQNLLRGNRKSA